MSTFTLLVYQMCDNFNSNANHLGENYSHLEQIYSCRDSLQRRFFSAVTEYLSISPLCAAGMPAGNMLRPKIGLWRCLAVSSGVFGDAVKQPVGMCNLPELFSLLGRNWIDVIRD